MKGIKIFQCLLDKNLAHEVMTKLKYIGYRDGPVKEQVMNINIEGRLSN